MADADALAKARAIFGVDGAVSPRALRDRYLALARRWHPDRFALAAFIGWSWPLWLAWGITLVPGPAGRRLSWAAILVVVVVVL